MIISFSNAPFVLACVCALLVLASHCASAFFGCKIARYATPVGAVLHLPLLVLLFFAGAELDLFVAVLLASVLVYSLLNYVAYKKGQKGGRDA